MPADVEPVVFDCVVCAQAIINPNGPAGACFELVRGGRLTLCISEYLLREIRELPGKISPRLRITPEKVDQFVVDLVYFSRTIETVPEIYTLDRDPEDSHYVNLALAAQANLITSRDRDLLDLMTTTRGDAEAFRRLFPDLRILTPEALLARIRGQAQP